MSVESLGNTVVLILGAPLVIFAFYQLVCLRRLRNEQQKLLAEEVWVLTAATAFWKVTNGEQEDDYIFACELVRDELKSLRHTASQLMRQPDGDCLPDFMEAFIRAGSSGMTTEDRSAVFCEVMDGVGIKRMTGYLYAASSVAVAVAAARAGISPEYVGEL